MKGKGVAAPDDDNFDTDALLDKLENSSDPNQVLRAIPNLANKLSVLASMAQQREMMVQRDAHAELEARLDEHVAPRNVRSFRVIKFVDYFPENGAQLRKPCTREAQLTIWDANVLEGIEFVEGKKYAVTNLVPTSVGAWRALDYGDPEEVYLATRRDTKWMPVE